MPAERMSMRRAREILRLKFESALAVREIVRRTGVPRRTVRTLIERFGTRGLTWPLGDVVSEDELEALLFKDAGRTPTAKHLLGFASIAESAGTFHDN